MLKTDSLFHTLLVAVILVTPSLLVADDDTKEKKGPETGAAVTATVDSKIADIKVVSYPESTLSCVMSNPKCSIFARAIHESGLEETLAQAKSCTIFVPSNKAFETWAKEDLDDLFSCKPALTALVLNHICPKPITSELVKCNNGFVYTIDKVQLPRSLRIYRALQAAEAQPVEISVEEVEVSTP